MYDVYTTLSLTHICTSSQADTHARSEKGTTIAADEGGEVADIEHLAGPSKPETAGREATPPAAHPEKSPEVIGPHGENGNIDNRHFRCQSKPWP